MGSIRRNHVFDGTAYIDLAKGELRNPRVHVLGSAPGSPVTGQIYYDSGTNKMYYWNGSAWIDTSGGASFAAPSLTLGTANAAGSATTTIRSDASIAIFDATAPSTQAFGDAAAVGAAAVAPRRDHKHAMPAHDDAAHSAIHLNALAAATANYSMGGNLLTSVGTPVSGTDAANKAYVDAAAVGIDWKASVRAATTANGALATAYANGQVIDGVTLATGDRILIKNQTTGSENGIYTVNAAGAPTRATDADSNAEVTAGLSVFVEEGTVNADSGWVITNNGAITLGTTALVFTQFTGLGQVVDGAALLKTGNTLDVQVAGGAGGIEISSDALRIAAAAAGAGLAGGAGSALAVGAGATPGSGGPGGGLVVNADDVVIDTAVVARKYATGLTGGATSEVITHNLNTRDVIVQVYNNATPWDQVEVDIEATSVNTVTIRGAANLPAGYRVVVHG